jgi:hypothetical protein
MIGPGIARELAREREDEIARRAREAHLLADAMPAVTLIGGVVLALAIGMPTGP